MDESSHTMFLSLLRTQRVAALGTLRDGGPLVSLTPFAPAPDLSAFYIHISRLAQHTQDILKDPRVSLMVAQSDDGLSDPLALGRISMRGQAQVLLHDDPAYAAARTAYLNRFPQAAATFQLGDFALYRIEPKTARFVAGFGKTFNLTAADFRQG